MKRLTENPFKFGDPVKGDYYYPRPELAATVTQFLMNRIHVVLMGPRRFGKTSFVLNLFQQLEEEGYTCLLIDIFNITSHRDFLSQLLRALRGKRGFRDNLKDFWSRMGRLLPKLHIEADPVAGTTGVSLGLGPVPEGDVKEAIQDALEGLAALGKRVVIALDEFQQISQLKDDGWLEATMRTHFQRLDNVSFLFTGSRKSLIGEMLNDPARPLYRSGQIIEFPTFGPDFSDWIIGRFRTVGIECSRGAIDHLRSLVQDTPNYVQMVCFHLVAQARLIVNEEAVEEALTTVARQNSYAYQTILNSLTLPQQRVLRLAANEGQSLFQKRMLERYEISTAPALHSSLNALKSKGLLDEEGTSKGRVRFDDPLFAYWLKMTFPM